MVTDTKLVVTTEEFRENLGQYVAAAKNRSGMIALLEDAELVGFFISAVGYKEALGAAVDELLAKRTKGRTFSQKQAQQRIRRVIQKRSKK